MGVFCFRRLIVLIAECVLLEDELARDLTIALESEASYDIHENFEQMSGSMHFDSQHKHYKLRVYASDPFNVCLVYMYSFPE